MSAATPPPTAYDRYRPYRRWVEWGAWIVLILLGVVPTWPHSKGWGYGPSGVLGIVLVVVIVMLLTGRL